MPSDENPPISVTPKVKVGDDVYVNEAAIELLQGRVEARVRTSILTMVGIPVTGGGIIAVAIAAVYWIPAQVGKVVEDNQAVKDQIASTVAHYLEEGRGQEFLARETESQLRDELPAAVDRHIQSSEIASLVSRELPASVETYFDTGSGNQVIAEQLPSAVNSYMAGDTGQQVIADRLKVFLESDATAALLQSEIAKDTPEAVAQYLSEGTGRQEVERVVQDQIDNERIDQVIRDTVNRVLRNTATARASSIEANRKTAMTVVGTPFVEKGGLHTLDEFLDSSLVLQAAEEGRPLAISFTVGHQYSDEVIEHYLTETCDRFPDSDVYVIVHDFGGECLAFCGPVVQNGELRTGLAEPDGRNAFIQFVLDAANDRFWDMVEDLNEIVPTVVTDSLKEGISLESALRSDVWRNPDDVLAPVVVVDENRRFRGTTTREQLIAALMGQARRGS